MRLKRIKAHCDVVLSRSFAVEINKALVRARVVNMPKLEISQNPENHKSNYAHSTQSHEMEICNVAQPAHSICST